MKKYVNVTGWINATYLVGDGKEIKAVYKSIKRAYFEWRTELHPLYLDDAIEFNPDEIYGLCIDESFNLMTIVNEDKVMDMIAFKEIVDVDELDVDDEFDDEFDFDFEI